TDAQEASIRPLGAAFGHFTADMTLDLAVLNADGTVAILANDGTGRFEGVQSLRVSGAPFAIAAGDVTGDGIEDIVVAHDTVLTVYAGNGVGGLEAGRVWQVGTVNALALADLTNDGDAEVVVANGDEGTVTILVAGADGQVGHREVLPVNGRVTSLLGADVAGGTGVDVVSIFGASNEIAVMVAGRHCASDVNGDGTVDMLDINAVIESMSAGAATFEDLNEVLEALGSDCN
ncbi:MAG: VCBS repeat-containing protein, partial [Phycisphaerales bacterium]|nr:VCBS repeat-containing protein [Phycisphaerales bacterium]